MLFFIALCVHGNIFFVCGSNWPVTEQANLVYDLVMRRVPIFTNIDYKEKDLLQIVYIAIDIGIVYLKNEYKFDLKCTKGT